jgi:hypothetical protein
MPQETEQWLELITFILSEGITSKEWQEEILPFITLQSVTPYMIRIFLQGMKVEKNYREGSSEKNCWVPLDVQESETDQKGEESFKEWNSYWGNS